MEVFLSLNDAERYAKENHMSSGELSYIYNEFYLLITKDILKSKINYFVDTLIEEVLENFASRISLIPKEEVTACLCVFLSGQSKKFVYSLAKGLNSIGEDMEKQVLETLTMDISFDNVSSSLQFDTEEQIKEDLMFDFEQMEYVIIANDDYLN